MNPPEEIMIQLLLGWNLERGDSASLGIEPGHDMPDASVLASGIHGLKNDEDGTPVFSIEPVLKIIQPLDIVIEEIFRLFLRLESRGKAGIDFFKIDPAAGPHSEAVGKFTGFHLSSPAEPAGKAAPLTAAEH